MIKNIPDNLPAHIKERAIKLKQMFDSGRGPRERYINAVEHFSKFKHDRSHFISLLRKNDLNAVEDMIYLANQPIEKELQYNNPSLYKLLNETIEVFKKSNFHHFNATMIAVFNRHLNKHNKIINQKKSI